MKRKVLVFCGTLLVVACLLTQAVNATVIFTSSGISAKGVDVSFEARLTISGDILTIQLTNNSPMATLNPDDTLSSFYFDILDFGNNRPALTYSSASGDVYLVSRKNPDVLQTANANIMATTAGDNTWMFKIMDETNDPFLGFGIGTVGNSNLTPNNFQGLIVDGFDYSIYTGEITTQNLNNKLLVKDTATFTFTGLTEFTEDDIVRKFAFGLGTIPDNLLTPEPTTICLIGLGTMVLLRKRKA